jgi:hypothetical protein
MTLTGYTMLLVAPVPRPAAAESVPADTAELRPRIEVDQPEHDFGDIEIGRNARCSFAIRNTGRAPLEIGKVTLTCQCLIVEHDRTIAPGEIGAVRVLMNAGERSGHVLRHLKVFSNDPENPALQLTIRARVFRPIEVLPSQELLVPLTPGRAATLELLIRCNEDRPLEISKVESSHPMLRARLLAAEAPPSDSKPHTPVSKLQSPTEQEPGARSQEPGAGAKRLPDQRLELVIPKEMPQVTFDATVTLHVNRPERPEIVIRVTGYPQNAVVANPPRLYLGDVISGSAAPVARTITLFRRDGAFRVIEAKATDPALILRVDPGADGTYSDIQVAYRGGWRRGPVSGKITIRTDDPGRPLIEVPFEANVSE